HREDIAAVIMEPVPVNTNGAFPNPGYLEGVRELCDDNGIVLIFDEVITGYRIALGGAQEYLGVTPDVVTLAKAVAGGFPLSIVAGKQKIMDSIADGSVMHAGTASGNITSLVAAEATIIKLKENGGEAIKYLHYIGSRLVDGLKRLGQKHEEDILIQGPAPIFCMAFTREEVLPDYRSFKEHADHERYARFRQELLERGVRTTAHGKWFLSTAHTEEDIDQTLDAADGAFRAL
ncbi:MAG: aminotransferase class III-fold pyridoxal phosphate-dependent enzyme, partial [Dehalococcoidia bacterium]